MMTTYYAMGLWRTATRTAPALALLLMTGCTAIDTHRAPPADWPELTVIEHRVTFLEVQRACAPGAPVAVALVTGVYLGCAWVRFDLGTCEVWLLDSQEDDGVREHELEHCRGRDHVGSSTFADGWRAYKNGRLPGVNK